MRSSQCSENWQEEEIKKEPLKPSSKNEFKKLHVNTCTFQNFNPLSCKRYYCSDTNLYSRLQAAPRPWTPCQPELQKLCHMEILTHSAS